MKEFIVNEFIALKFEKERETVIYIAGERFQQCKYLFLNIPAETVSFFDEIESIDEASEIWDKSIKREYHLKSTVRISPEDEFWAHCSNIQTFYENSYDTRILHSNLAFPLLKKLYEVGDPLAKKVFKEEVAIRISSKNQNTVLFLLENDYQLYLSSDEFQLVYKGLQEDKKELIKNFIHDKFNNRKTNTELKNKLFIYLEIMSSEHELQEIQYVSINDKKFFLIEDTLIISNVEKIEDVRGLHELKGLKKLRVHSSSIASTEGFDNLRELEQLKLNRNKVNNINGLIGLPNLKVLDLSFNKVEEITGLGNLKNLEELLLG